VFGQYDLVNAVADGIGGFSLQINTVNHPDCILANGGNNAIYYTSLGSRWLCDSGVTQYDIYENINPNFTGNQYSNGTAGAQTFGTQTYNSMLSSVPSTGATWSTTNTFCENGIQYNFQEATNQCSITYGQTRTVETGDNSSCWQESSIYYQSCADAVNNNNRYQSYVLNDVYTVGTFGNTEPWGSGGNMTGEWYVFLPLIDNYPHRVTFTAAGPDIGKIEGTDLNPCTP
jgi:hypothetical protein